MNRAEKFKFWDREIKRTGKIIFVDADRVELTQWFMWSYDLDRYYPKSRQLQNGFKSLTVEKIVWEQ